MIGRDQYSVIRSLRRYLGLVLMDYEGALPTNPWDVQFVRREPQQRPLAVSRLVGPRTSSGTAYVRHYVQQAEIFAYPLGVESNAAASEVEAQHISNILLRAFDTGNAAAGGYACRVPFFDFTGIGPEAVLPTGTTTITADPGATGTTLAITAYLATWPTVGPFKIRIGNEEMLVTAGWGTTSLTVERARNGTIGMAHAIGATVSVVVLPFGFLVLSNLTADVRQDPETDDLFTVMLDLRVSWSDDGDIRRFGGTPLEYVTAHYFGG